MTISTKSWKPKVIFFAPILEYPPAGGPQLSVVNAVKVLHQISELHIVTTVPPGRIGSPDALLFFKQHSHALLHTPSSKWTVNNRLFDRILRKVKRVLAPIFAKLDVDYMVKYASLHDVEVFWVDRVLEHAFSVFRQLRLHRPKAIIVGDTEAVYSRFILRELPLVTNPLRRFWISLKGRNKEVEERELTTKADIVTAVSEVDAEYFRSIAPDSRRIKLFSNVVDLRDFDSLVDPLMQLKHPCVLLLGSYGHQNSPMDRAAKWVAHDIMPLVWRQVPDAHLYIIGRNANLTQASLNSDGITVVGQVPSVLPYLQQAAATLVPLRFESGTRFKIIESGAASVPCVSTTLGAEGLHVTDKKNILIADTVEDFAEAIVQVLVQPALAASLGRHLHTLVVEHYSLEAQIREGQSIIQHLKKCTCE